MTAATEPVAIGGIGGSGTRVVAALLQRLGRFMGSDLNPALDNLWFTLLFKRPSILLESRRDFAWLCDQFWMRMNGTPDLDEESLGRIAGLAAPGRVPHGEAWFQRRVQSWKEASSVPGRAWGWKEPNTHLVIDRMFDLQPGLRYIHVLRNPLDMALSANQNQLLLWGSFLLDRPVVEGPRDSLSYCCAVARRIGRISGEYPGRVHQVDFERLCSDPGDVAREVAAFVGAPIDDDISAWFSDLLRQGAPAIDRYKSIQRSAFAPDDLKFVAELGYGSD